MTRNRRSAAIAFCHYTAIATLLALIALSIAWEGMIAPLRPGGSWLILKVLPLLLPLFGVLRGTRYTYQWASMLIWLYLSEGIVRAWSDRPPASGLAVAETALAGGFFVAAIFYARLTAPAQAASPAAPAGRESVRR